MKGKQLIVKCIHSIIALIQTTSGPGSPRLGLHKLEENMPISENGDMSRLPQHGEIFS